MRRLAGKLELLVEAARARQGISNDDGALRTEQASENAQHRRMQVYAIRDDLALHRRRQRDRPHRPGVAVVQWGHRVATMGGMRGAKLNGLQRLLVAGVGVANAHGDASRDQAANQLGRARQLGRQRDESQLPLGKRQEPRRLSRVRHA